MALVSFLFSCLFLQIDISSRDLAAGVGEVATGVEADMADTAVAVVGSTEGAEAEADGMDVGDGAHADITAGIMEAVEGALITDGSPFGIGSTHKTTQPQPQ